jgi:ligand-binding SRPBCC domain-containing protein
MRSLTRFLTSLPGSGAIHVLERSQVVHRSQPETFAFFADARNLEAITPPWLQFRIATDEQIVMRRGALIDYRLRLRGLPLLWRSRIAVWDPPYRFVDLQVLGPYAFWEHTHEVQAVDDGVTRIDDRVRYALPLWRAGDFAHAAIVRPDLERIFDYRQSAIAERLTGLGA